MPRDGTSVGTVRSVERAVNLLLQVAQHDAGVSLQQLSRELNCSKSTAHRLLGTLEQLEVVQRDPQSRHYQLGRRARELSGHGGAQADLREAAQPLMRRLRDESQETVTLHQLDGTVHLVVEQFESPQEIRRILPLGQRVPLIAGATAKAILSFMDPQQAEAVLEETSTPKQQGPSEAERRDIRSLGYVFSVSERVPGGSSLSAPVFDRGNRVCAAISISGPSFRFTSARATRLAQALLDATTEVSAALGSRISRQVLDDGSR